MWESATGTLLLLLLAEIAGIQAPKAHPILLLVPMRPNCARSQRLSPHQASFGWAAAVLPFVVLYFPTGEQWDTQIALTAAHVFIIIRLRHYGALESAEPASHSSDTQIQLLTNSKGPKRGPEGHPDLRESVN